MLTDKHISWFFLIPTFVVLTITAFIPLLYSLWLSMHRYKINIPNAQPFFIGLENYFAMFEDVLLRRSTMNTIVFAIITVILEVCLGLIIAMLVSSDNEWARWLRAILLVPMIMAPVASGTLWRMMLDRTTGIVNYLMQCLGLPAVPWLIKTLTSLISIIFVDVWRMTPWVVIILVSALKAIPISYIEAASIDVASPFKIFTKILCPLLKPIIIIIFMIRLVDAFKVFDIVYVMTGGGPGMATEMLPNFIYNQGLRYFNVGYAAALAWTFILVIALLIYIFIQYRVKVRTW